MAKAKVDTSGFDKLIKSAKQAHQKVKIGIADGGKGSPAEYAQYVEYGWLKKPSQKQRRFIFATTGANVSTLYNPPRPFFRMTYEKYSDEWIKKGLKIYNLEMQKSMDCKKATEKYLKLVGQLGVQDLQRTIETHGQEFGFAKRSPLTLAIFKALHKGKEPAQGNEPLVDSGALLRSITFELV